MSEGEVNTDFLPLIYDIIRSIERDSHDGSQKRENYDSSQKVQELKQKLQQCRDQIQKLPGIEYSREEQLKRLESLRKQLALKRELLLKYKNMCHFDIPKL
ncbi:mediator of RNA polymerase II transcription subunit 9-like [Limulus polyphemus]|uniref:Mediator of RNA polymerase II transcription subunit 9 n=1 Tax=Limulus polyphemus TaxID=6850 RepID=A0ABM1B719_LIMPO|nr:mediator of RNA polymerase II transcription subunit 9-like [Limulus polyphemus]